MVDRRRRSKICPCFYFSIVHMIITVVCAADAPLFGSDDLISTRLAVPVQIDFASAVGAIDEKLNNYGNPADVYMKRRTLNLSLGQSHWPLLPFLGWSYSAHVPLRIGFGTPMGDGYVAATMLMDYLFYGNDYSGGERLHRGLLGGDFHASYKGKLGVSGHWLTASQTLMKTVRMSARDESSFGLRIGGNLSSKYGCVARFDMHSYGELESRRYEFSVISPNHSLGYVHTNHRNWQGKVMWNHGLVFRISRRRRSNAKPLWLWWQARVSVAVGQAAGDGYLGWEIDCYPPVEDCEKWTRSTVFEYEARIGGKYRCKSRPWTVAAQAGVMRSSDYRGLFWNDGIFHPTDWGRIGLAANFIHQIRGNQQWIYTVGYEHMLPYIGYDKVTLHDIGGPFVKLGLHFSVELRYAF